MLDQDIAKAVSYTHHVLVEHVSPVRPPNRSLHESRQVMFFNKGIVSEGGGLALGTPLLQESKLHPEDSCLESVKSGIPTHVLVVIFWLHAVDAQAGHPGGQLRITGNRHAGIAKGSQVLTRVKTETADGPQIAGPFTEVFRTQGLGRIFHDGKIVPGRYGPQGFHVNALAKKVNGHDGPCPAGDFVFYLKRIEVIGEGIDVHENRASPGSANRPRAGEESKRRQNNLIARTNVQSV
jgi:hypothetical protein